MSTVRAVQVPTVAMPVVHTVRLHPAMIHGHPSVPVPTVAVITASTPASIVLPVLSPVVVPVSAVLGVCQLSGKHQPQ